MTDTPTTGARSTWIWISAFALAWVLVMANWVLEIVRFTSVRGNAIGLLVAQALPFAAIVVTLVGLRAKPRWIVTTALGMIGVVAISIAALIGLAWALGLAGIEESFERIAEYEAGAGTVVVYRTNGGATTNYGIVIRQEARLAPGVVLVRRLDHIYPASSASIEIVAPDEIRASLGENDGILSDPISRTYHLRWLVYL